MRPPLQAVDWVLDFLVGRIDREGIRGLATEFGEAGPKQVAEKPIPSRLTIGGERHSVSAMGGGTCAGRTVDGVIVQLREPGGAGPARHPLRKIKAVVDAALAALDADFERLYAGEGRPSIAPERLMRAASCRSCSRSAPNAVDGAVAVQSVFRWFVGLSIDEPVWVPTVFTKNRDRLLTTEMSRKLMAAILAHEKVAPLLSDDHFSVDGTLVEAWASFKSFRPKSPTSDAPPPDADPPPPASTGAGRKAYDTAGTEQVR